jgi:aminoglycoside phosphotransferase (APT) family kinase protein
MHHDEVDVDAHLVERLLALQFPALAGLPVRIVEPWGTDHAVFRLGDDHVVRLPRIDWARGQPDKEARWLPVMASYLPVAVPRPVAVGEPALGYPFRWAIHGWIPGELASFEGIRQPERFALDLADVVVALRAVPTDDAPPAHGRARPLTAYDDATRDAIERCRDLIDADGALALWDDALSAPAHAGPPVWVQGDLDGNCLIDGGALCGVVDWGSACVGDPAVDLQVVWGTLFTPRARDVFLEAVDADEASVRRSRGAAINQACMALPYYRDTYPLIVERSRHKLRQLGVGVAD